MKRKAKICIALILLITTLLSLMISVNAASGAFDTQNFASGSVNFGGGAKDESWGARKATGTRFVLELNDKEVGGSNSYKYYVNYMQNKTQSDSALAVGSMYHGGYLGSNCYWTGGSIDTNGMTAAKQVTNFTSKTTQYVDDPPSNAGKWFNNWRTTGSINLNITEEGNKFLAKIIAAKALDLNDTNTYNQMKSIVEGTYEGKLAVKAEIVFSLRTPSDKKDVLITYNEFRRIANDGSHGGGVRWMRGGSETTDGGGLDKIASKLYEKHSEYSLKNGKVNCSCNFLGSNSFTYDGKYLCYSGYSGSETITKTNVSDRKLPNICTMAVSHSGATRYYGAGLRDVNGKTVGSNIKVNGTTPANPDWSYRCPGSDIVSNTGMKSNGYTSPVIFEGWDYIYSEYVKPKYYTVTEKYLEEGTNNVLATEITKSGIESGSSYTANVKTISGYTYTKSSPTGTKHTITSNKEIVHYYKAIPKEFTITEAWVVDGTNVALKTAESNKIKVGENYTFKGPDAYSSTEYVYYKSTTTNQTVKHEWNSTTEAQIKVSKDYNVVHYYERVYTVTEKYMLKDANIEIDVPFVTHIPSGETYYVTIKNISNFVYDSSSPAGSSHVITSNLEIIHYYTTPTPIITSKDLIYAEPTVTKGAVWTNDEKTEAEITITVKAEYDKSETKIESADIIYLLDKSYSMGKEVNTSYTKVRNAIGEKLSYYLTNQYNGAGNRVGFATFSSSLYTYGHTNTVKDEKAGRTRTNYNRPNGAMLGSTTALNYSQAKKRIFTNFDSRANSAYKGTYTARFYTTPNDITNVVNGLKNHEDGENTNFDLPLFYAQWLLENRTKAEQSRRSFVIFITEGQPYPNDNPSRESQASGNPDYKNSDYLANKFYAQIAADLRNTYGTEIYAIILERDKASKSMWETICGDSSHIFYTPDTQTDAIKAINKIHDKIALEMQKSVEYADAAPMSLTDMINTDYFEVISTNASETCTTNTGSTSISNNKVYWNLGTVSYNKKCSDGQWPTLKIKIRLKDENTVGRLNTNYNKPKDDQCILTYPDGEVKKPTPWLDRESLKTNVTIKHIDDERQTTIETERYDNVQKNTNWPITGKIKDYAVTRPQGQWGTAYKGYYLDTTNIVINGKTYTSLAAVPEKVFITGDVVIEFHYKLEQTELSIRYIEFKKKDGKLSPEFKTFDGGTKEIKVEKEQSIKVTKPSSFGGKSVYTGYNLSKNGVPILSERILNNLSKATSPIKVKLNTEDTGAHLDIIYVEENYTLTVKYQDMYGNTIKGDVNKSYPPNTKVKLSEVEFENKIIFNGVEYLYETRDDGKTGTADIVMDVPEKIVIFKYEAQVVPVKINFMLKGTTTQIADPQTTTVLPGNNVYVEVVEPENTKEYAYDSRSDAKARTEKVGPVTGATEVTLWYVEKIPVTIRFKDWDTKVEIADAQIEKVDPGDNVSIIEPEATKAYKYLSRSDGKARTADIKNVQLATEVIFWYTQTVDVTIRFVDKITNSDIVTPPQTGEVKINEGTVPVEYWRVSDEYKYINRTDGKTKESDPVGPVTTDTEVILYYWKDNPSIEGSGLPVVSYPEVTAEYNRKENGKAAVIVGEEITVTIPNNGSHKQMNEIGETQPENGWNGVYGQVEYLICDFDVYYNNNKHSKGTPIRVANRSDIENGNVTVKLLVPEWVEEKEWKGSEVGYTITAIVGSENKDANTLKNSSSEDYNILYEKVAAIGEAKINVYGKVYDFTITNLVEDKMWESSLFGKEYHDPDGISYKANLDSTDSKIGVLPIGQGPNGRNTDKQQAQKYNHGIALGSTFFFNVNTLGKKNQTVSIKPTFKYVPVNSTADPIDVDLYIETGNGKYENILETDEQVIKTQLNNEHKKKNTNLGLEMSCAFGIGNGIIEFKDLKTNASHDLVTGARLRLDKNDDRVPFEEYFEEEGITRYTKGSKEYDEVLASAYHWYGEYRIPSSTKVMAKGDKPGNGTEYKNGFIIVLFQIITQDIDDETIPHDNEEHKYLVYNEQFVGDQWHNEGGTKTSQTMTLTMPRLMGVAGTKTVNLTVANGTYPVAIYDVAVRANGQYEAAGTH